MNYLRAIFYTIRNLMPGTTPIINGNWQYKQKAMRGKK